MASSSGNERLEAGDAVGTSSLNTIAMSHTIETIAVESEEGHTQEAEGANVGDSRSTSCGDPTEILAKGIASVLGPVVRNFETSIEEVVKSQHTLENSIDRLTGELDKLLEDTPLPVGGQHAAKLSGIRKRVGSLSDALRIIQGRINSMETMLSDPSVNLSPK